MQLYSSLDPKYSGEINLSGAHRNMRGCIYLTLILKD